MINLAANYGMLESTNYALFTIKCILNEEKNHFVFKVVKTADTPKGENVKMK